MKSLFTYSLVIFSALFISCGSNEKKSDEKEEATEKKENPLILNGPEGLKEGVLGVITVPEMLALAKMDSAAVEDMSFKLSKDYSILEEELHAIGAEMEGSPGVINYNNDPKNFKFECLLLIKHMPAKEPKQCKIVALESAKMVVYNYYGPYEQLINGYNKIREYCKEKHLIQTGPMREFYITDPTLEKDPAKWMTRILVPVY